MSSLEQIWVFGGNFSIKQFSSLHLLVEWVILYSLVSLYNYWSGLDADWWDGLGHSAFIYHCRVTSRNCSNIQPDHVYRTTDCTVDGITIWFVQIIVIFVSNTRRHLSDKYLVCFMIFKHEPVEQSLSLCQTHQLFLCL